MDSHSASSPVPWPPIIFGGALLLGIVAGWLQPFAVFPADWSISLAIAGAACFAAGFALLATAVRLFARAGTPAPPNRPTKLIVAGGIYRFTRNPMYAGMALMLAGLGLAFNSAWLLLLVPVGIYAVTKLAIEREEAYLSARFGADYLAYKSQVRRWL